MYVVFFLSLYKSFLNDRISMIVDATRKTSLIMLIHIFIILHFVLKHFKLLKWRYIALIGICLCLRKEAGFGFLYPVTQK